MADLAQVVAAVATGALLTVATALAFRLYAIQRRAERERKINAAVTAIVAGVETFRRPPRADPKNGEGHTPGLAVEVRSKAHLRMLVGGGTVPRSCTSCGLPQQSDRATGRQRVRESRP